MQHFKRWIGGISVLLALCMAVTMQAQTPGTPKGAGKAPKQGGKHAAALAQMPVNALDFAVGGLKAEQQTRITAIQDKFKADRKAAAGDKAKASALATKATEDIQDVLTPDQVSKLKDMTPMITLLNSSKAVPMNALAEVKLTEDQRNKIRSAAAETADKIKAVPKADRKTKSQELLAEFKKTVDGILTDTQKAAVAKAAKGKGKKQDAAPKPGKQITR